MSKARWGFVKLTPDLKSVLGDFTWLFWEIANKPINIAQIVPVQPTYESFTNACKHAAGGGEWILPTTNPLLNRYVLWEQVIFPSDILVSFHVNCISINDLEMAGVLLGWLALEHLVPSLIHAQAGTQCDNSSMVHWTQKFSARSLVAGHLLCALLAL